MQPRRYRYRIGLCALAAALATHAACSSSNDDTMVRGSVVLVDRHAQPLSMANLRSVNGRYGPGCRQAAGLAWSVEIVNGATLTNDPLAVVRADPDCDLTLTELVTNLGRRLADLEILLTEGYQATASSFGANEFSANASLSMDALMFLSDFTITIRYSEETNTMLNVPAGFAVSESTAVGLAVPAPDNVLDFTAFDVLTDFSNVVEAVAGTIALSSTTTPGADYVVLDAPGLTEYDEIEAAFVGFQARVSPLPATAFTTGTAFLTTLVGEDLSGSDVTRTLIFRNTVAGVHSYQAFEFTFLPPV